MLIDTHCHLASHRFGDEEIPKVVGRAAEAGVSRLITISTDLNDARRNLEIVETCADIFATVGIHPTSTPEIDDADWLDKIRAWTGREKVLALGEIGLDFFHPAPKPLTEERYRAMQEEYFRAQLELAVDLGLNVVIHQRNSYDAIMEVMQPFHGKVTAVFHCFSGDWDQAKQLLDLGHCLSFTGIVTYKDAAGIRDAARQAPLDRIMVETDAPYLAPVPHRGHRCEPAFTRATAEFIAALRGLSFQEFAAATTATAEAFFGLQPTE